MRMRECVLSGWNKGHKNETLFFCGLLSLLLADLIFIFYHHFDYAINEKKTQRPNKQLLTK